LKTFTELLLICTEKTTRDCVADLFSFILNTLVPSDFSAESCARKFIDAVFEIIPTECGKYWTRF
jgi:hypothetical protein